MSIQDASLAAGMLAWADQMEAESTTVGRLLAMEVRSKVAQYTESLTLYSFVHDVTALVEKTEKEIDSLEPSLHRTQPYGKGFHNGMEAVAKQLRRVLDQHVN